MILTVLAALFGALLGTMVRGRGWAVLLAVTTVGFVHAVILLAAIGWIGSGGNAADTAFLLSLGGGEPADLGGTISAAGLAAVFAGMMVGRGDEKRRRAGAAFERAAVVGPSGQRTDVLLLNR